jgi:hypothetical protein
MSLNEKIGTPGDFPGSPADKLCGMFVHNGGEFHYFSQRERAGCPDGRYGFQVFRSRRTILSEIALLKKENEILPRKTGKKNIHFGFYDKFFLVVLNRVADIKRQLTLVKPETVLSWQRNLIKWFWTFEHSPAKRARKPVDADVKDLILSMKNENLIFYKNNVTHNATQFKVANVDWILYLARGWNIEEAHW